MLEGIIYNTMVHNAHHVPWFPPLSTQYKNEQSYISVGGFCTSMLYCVWGGTVMWLHTKTCHERNWGVVTPKEEKLTSQNHYSEERLNSKIWWKEANIWNSIFFSFSLKITTPRKSFLCVSSRIIYFTYWKTNEGILTTYS